MKRIKVFINDKDRTMPRQLVEVEIVEDLGTAVRVRLPDGNIISRKKKRDFPPEETK